MVILLFLILDICFQGLNLVGQMLVLFFKTPKRHRLRVTDFLDGYIVQGVVGILGHNESADGYDEKRGNGRRRTLQQLRLRHE
jgi:hypothetical protein